MCGICGIIDRTSDSNRDVVLRMCEVLQHRGPDDQGTAMGQGWALGHRRLSIVDLSARARQPMINEDKTSFLVCNGEVFNHMDIRRELISRGHNFVSESDSEAVLHLMEEGVHGIQRLTGMFAFAFLDNRRRKMVLCRDRLGIKPLYYTRSGQAFLFASEIKALFCHPGVHPEFDRTMVRELLQYHYVAGEHGLFKGVRELMPGHYLELDLDSMESQVVSYWHPDYTRESSSAGEEALLPALKKSVKTRLMSDVPLGSQLSGGLDSSLITALATRETTGSMHTFSVSFSGTDMDESRWAKLISSRLGTIHHVIDFGETDFLQDLAYCAWLNDTPLTHPNSVPLFRMCQEAKKSITVMLTGEGADELFAGYSWHRRLRRISRLGSLRKWAVTGYIASSVLGRQRGSRVRDLLGLSVERTAAEAGKLGQNQLVNRILLPGLEPQAVPFRETLPALSEDLVSEVLRMDLLTYLVSVLQRQDRMGMASGVEARVPFLDHKFVELAIKLPVAALFDGNRGKAVVRRMAAGYLPESILSRGKVGFAVPVERWMRYGGDCGRLLSWLCMDRAGDRGLWQMDALKHLVEQHRDGSENHEAILWSLLSLELWMRLWIDGESHETLKHSIQSCVGGDRRFPGAIPGKKQALNICQVVPSLEVGGMERVVIDLLKHHAAAGDKGTLFCTDKKGEFYDLIDVPRECAFRRHPRLLINWDVVGRLVRFIRSHSIDVIHTHNHVAHLYGVLASIATGKPVVLTIHGQGVFDTWRTRWVRKLLAAGTDVVIAVSDNVGALMQTRRIVSPLKIKVIRNGIDLELIDSQKAVYAGVYGKLRREHGIPENAFVIGSVGRFAVEKDYPLMIRAFARLLNSYQLLVNSDQSSLPSVTNNQSPITNNQQLKLLIVGDGTERDKINSLIRELGLENHVILPGIQKDVFPWLFCMDVFSLSSFSEGTPMTLLEAGACGLPAVVTNVGGNPEVVQDGVTGLVVPPGDEAALAAAFARVAQDKGLCSSMGNSANYRIRTLYSFDQMMAGYSALYRGVLNMRSG